MKQVLFVDDQPEVLRALKRMLGCMEQEWEMAFAGGGLAALELMGRERFDVIVTDMRMPGMDGAQLLDHVSRLHPETVRIVLSGEANRAAVLRAVKPMHQYLSKPCDTETLRSTVARACALRDMLSDPALHQLVSKISSLPSVPSLYAELVDEIESPDVSVKRIGEIVSQDIAMTAKILQLANSAIVGLRQPVSNPAQATTLLGLETLKALVLTVQAFSQFRSANLPRFSIDGLLQHSHAVGCFARSIANAEGADAVTGNDAFVAGMLHDTGKLILAANAAEQYGAALELAVGRPMPLFDAEREIFGTSHAAVGAYMLGLWGLPEPIVQAIALHHQPALCGDRRFSVVTAVHVANAIEREQDQPPRMPPTEVAMDHLQRLGRADRLAAWREICRPSGAERAVK